jgi:hypothetical protein
MNTLLRLPAPDLLNQFWNLEFAWDFGLTESASRDGNPVFGLFGPTDDGLAILVTFVFIMTFFRDRSGRTAGRAGLARFVKVV